jgi:hypothetical protein
MSGEPGRSPSLPRRDEGWELRRHLRWYAGAKSSLGEVEDVVDRLEAHLVLGLLGGVPPGHQFSSSCSAVP